MPWPRYLPNSLNTVYLYGKDQETSKQKTKNQKTQNKKHKTKNTNKNAEN